MKKISGTNEWSVKTVNWQDGCTHNCRYCFARYDSVCRYKRMAARDWVHPTLRMDVVGRRSWPKYPGVVMVPSTHDILPCFWAAAAVVISNLCQVGNKVLIVTKPHLEVVENLCRVLSVYKDQIMWRFTIGSPDDDTLKYWEPGAPGFRERYHSLWHAYCQGFRTSVSIEPCLSPWNVEYLVKSVSGYVTDTIWIGLMNKIDTRVEIKSARDQKMVNHLKERQSLDYFQSIHGNLKDNTKVRWKESIATLLGLPLSDKPGEIW